MRTCLLFLPNIQCVKMGKIVKFVKNIHKGLDEKGKRIYNVFVEILFAQGERFTG